VIAVSLVPVRVPRDALSTENVSVIQGVSPLEIDESGQGFWWMTEPKAVLRLAAYGANLQGYRLELVLSADPCQTSRSISVRSASEATEHLTAEVSLGPEALEVQLDLDLPSTNDVEILELFASGEPCIIDSDSRNFFLRMSDLRLRSHGTPKLESMGSTVILAEDAS
jgi:hypothetical protein